MAEAQVALFYGDEYRCEFALASRIQAINAQETEVEKHILYADEIDPYGFAMELSSASLFSHTRHFVVRRTESLKQKAFSTVVSRSLPPKTYLSFVAVNLKSTSSLLKIVKKVGDVASLPAFKGSQAIKEARRIIDSYKVQLTPRAKQEMIDHYSGDLLALREEMRKIKTYALEQSVDEDDVIALMFNTGEKSVYPLLDAIMSADLHEAMSRLVSLHEDPAGTFSALTRQLTRVLMIRTLLDSNTNAAQISSSLGMPGWMVRRFIGQANRHSDKTLAAALDLAIDLDTKAKNGGIRFHDALLKLMLFIADPLPPERGYARKSQLSPTASGLR
jgi:DNA polymerase III delta subunit